MLNNASGLFGKSNDSKIIGICINDDGDLANKYFNLASTGVGNVEQLYNASLALNATTKNVQSHNTSTAITVLKGQYQNISGDIRSLAKLDANPADQFDSPNTDGIFQKWSGWSDSNMNKQMKACANPAQDQFYQSQTLCPTGYAYTSASSAKVNLDKKACLVIKEWTLAKINERYSAYTCGSDSDFTNSLIANGAYWNGVSNFIDQNTILLNEIINDHDTRLSVQFSGTISSLLTLLTKVNGLVTPLINLLDGLVGKNSLYQMINCKFMAIDLKNIINVFGGEFSTSSKGLGIMIILISFLNAIGVIFTIFMLNFLIAPEAPAGEGDGNNIEMGKV